jgi:hypothetical protein
MIAIALSDHVSRPWPAVTATNRHHIFCGRDGDHSVIDQRRYFRIYGFSVVDAGSPKVETIFTDSDANIVRPPVEKPSSVWRESRNIEESFGFREASRLTRLREGT